MGDIHIHSNPDIIERLDKIIELLTASTPGFVDGNLLAQQVANRQNGKLVVTGSISTPVTLHKGEEVAPNPRAGSYRPSLRPLETWDKMMARLEKVERWIADRGDDNGFEPEPAWTR